MTIALDPTGPISIAENSVNNGPIAYTPTNELKGVVVLITQVLNDLNGPVTVDINGTTPLEHMTGSPVISTWPADGIAEAWFLGSGIPAGTININVTGNSVARNRAITVYGLNGAGDLIEQDTQVINLETTDDPRPILLLGGENCFCAQAVYVDAPIVNVTPLPDWTIDASIDPGNDLGLNFSYAPIQSSNVQAGFDLAGAGETVAMLALAVRESAPPGIPPSTTLETATETSPTQATVQFTVDQDSTYYIASDTSPTGVSADVKVNALFTGSALTGINSLPDLALLIPGSATYVHIAVENANGLSVATGDTNPLTSTPFPGSVTFSGATIPPDSSLYIVGGTQTAAGGANVLTDANLVDPDTGVDFVDDVLVGMRFINRTDVGASAIVVSNTGKTVTMGTITGGTANTIELNDAYDLVTPIDINDVIYHETTAQVVSAVGTYNQYIYDNSEDDYSATYTVTVSANGALDGQYTVTVDAVGVPTLAPPASTAPIFDDTIADQVAEEGTPYSLDVSGNFDTGGAVTSYSLQNAPVWMSINNSGVISGDPAEGVTNGITVTGTNATGSAVSNAFQMNAAALPLPAATLINAIADVPPYTTITARVDTDQPGGTLYYWATANAVETAANIIANGLSRAVSSTGTLAVSISQLSELTLYYVHFVQVTSANSNVIATNSVTTGEAPPVPLTSTVNDAILIVTGGPTVPDGLANYFSKTGSESLQDAEYRWLLAQGATAAAIQDMWFEYLRGAGFTGAFPDMYRDFWIAGGAAAPAAALVTFQGQQVTHEGEVVTNG